jgi:acyl-CoA thioesterase-2
MGFGTEWDDFDIRWGGPWPPMGHVPEGLSPHNQFWFRFTKDLPDDPVLNAAVLGYVSDLSFLTPVLLPHGAFMWSPGIRATSLDHAMWFHRPFLVTEWMLYDQYSPVASRGRGFVIGGISAADRGRVVSTAQEGMFRSKT